MLQSNLTHILDKTRKEPEFKVTLLFLMTYQAYKMFEEWSRIIFRLHQTYSYYQRWPNHHPQNVQEKRLHHRPQKIVQTIICDWLIMIAGYWWLPKLVLPTTGMSCTTFYWSELRVALHSTVACCRILFDTTRMPDYRNTAWAEHPCMQPPTHRCSHLLLTFSDMLGQYYCSPWHTLLAATTCLLLSFQDSPATEKRIHAFKTHSGERPP